MSDTFVGIQIGAISFIDEGVEEVLDILQEKAGVRRAADCRRCSWSIGNAGARAFGFPDHGAQERTIFAAAPFSRRIRVITARPP